MDMLGKSIYYHKDDKTILHREVDVIDYVFIKEVDGTYSLLFINNSNKNKVRTIKSIYRAKVFYVGRLLESVSKLLD